MTTPVELIIKVIKQGRGDAEAAQGLRQTMAAANDAARGFVSAAKGAAEMITGLGGAAAAAVATSKVLFDLGKSGAEITQTGNSFKSLMEIVGASPDTLDRLREASRGTVDDLTLMKSTTTLLAGAQGELATSLAQATPKLLEIAKAANKLNPTLGDTTFMYESLALGIKRGSPLILDNLGLTIKIGEANEKYAAALGKTVEQLTPAELKQALLNATLEAGSVLIKQAGGNVDSATDSYARMNTALSNTIDKGKMWLGEFLAPAADAIALLVTWQDKINDALEEQSARLLDTTSSYEEYLDKMLDAQQAAGKLNANERLLLEERLDTIDGIDALVNQYGIMTRWMYDAAKAAENEAQVTNEAQRAAAKLAVTKQEVTAATEDATAATDISAKTYRSALSALRDYNIGEAQRIELEQTIKLLTGELTAEEVARTEAISFLTKQLEIGNITQAEYIARLNDLATGAATARDTINSTSEAIRNIPDREVTIRYTYTTSGEPRPEHGDIGLPGGPGAPVTVTPPPRDDRPIGGMRASGGTYGRGWLITGERGPEINFASVPGYVMNNSDSARLLAALEMIAVGLNKPSINLSFQGSGNVAADMLRARAIAGSW